MKNKRERIRQIVENVINEQLLVEYGLHRDKFITSCYSFIGPLLENLMCVKMYPTCQTIQHWREQIETHGDNILGLNIKPQKNDIPRIRKKYMEVAVDMFFGQQRNSILNNFKRIEKWYREKERNRVLVPYTDPRTFCENHEEEILTAISNIIDLAANKDKQGVTNYAYNVY